MYQSRTNKPRVLQVITHLAQGGAERICFTLMRALHDQVDFGLLAVRGMEESDVGHAFADELQELDIPLFTGTKVSIKHGGMALAGLAMLRACRQFKPDLIHLHTEIPESTYASMAVLPTKWRDVPLIRTIHNTVLWTPWRKLGRWCEQHMIDSHIAAVSDAALTAYKDFRDGATLLALPSEPVVIFNGVKDSSATPSVRRATNSVVRLVFAGRLEPQKGADLLGEIVRLTKVPAGRSIDLTIWGAGTHGNDVAALAVAPTAPGWTIHVGPAVSNLRQRLAEFDFALLPSRYEGLCTVAIESIKESLPVIGTTAAGLKEIFPSSYPWLAASGDAASFADALSRAIASSDDHRKTVMAAAIAHVHEHFSVSSMADSYERLYQGALRGTVIPALGGVDHLFHHIATTDAMNIDLSTPAPTNRIVEVKHSD